MKSFTETAFATQRYLDYSFTTIRDCDVPRRVDVAVCNTIETGLFGGGTRTCLRHDPLAYGGAGG